MSLTRLTRLALATGAVLAATAPSALAAPAPPQPVDTSDDPGMTASVQLFDADGSPLRSYDCAWRTGAPDTEECFFVVADGPDAVDFLKKAGAARAETESRSEDGRYGGRSTLEQRSDGRWYFHGRATGSVGPREREFGFVADPTGRKWVRWEVSELPSTANTARARTSRKAVSRAKVKLSRKLSAKRRSGGSSR